MWDSQRGFSRSNITILKILKHHQLFFSAQSSNLQRFFEKNCLTILCKEKKPKKGKSTFHSQTLKNVDLLFWRGYFCQSFLRFKIFNNHLFWVWEKLRNFKSRLLCTFFLKTKLFNVRSSQSESCPVLELLSFATVTDLSAWLRSQNLQNQNKAYFISQHILQGFLKIFQGLETFPIKKWEICWNED